MHGRTHVENTTLKLHYTFHAKRKKNDHVHPGRVPHYDISFFCMFRIDEACDEIQVSVFNSIGGGGGIYLHPQRRVVVYGHPGL